MSKLVIASRLGHLAHQAKVAHSLDKVMEKTSVLVAIRVRPKNERELKVTEGDDDAQRLHIGGTQIRINSYSYEFDAILGPSHSQKRTYGQTAERILLRVLEGFMPINITYFHIYIYGLSVSLRSLVFCFPSLSLSLSLSLSPTLSLFFFSFLLTTKTETPRHICLDSDWSTMSSALDY